MTHHTPLHPEVIALLRQVAPDVGRLVHASPLAPGDLGVVIVADGRDPGPIAEQLDGAPLAGTAGGHLVAVVPLARLRALVAAFSLTLEGHIERDEILPHQRWSLLFGEGGRVALRPYTWPVDARAAARARMAN